MNTFQAILVTDGTTSYAIYTYRCGEINWARSPSIGFNAAGRVFDNHPLAGNPSASAIDCNGDNMWNNVIYNLTGYSLNITAPPSVEPRKNLKCPVRICSYWNERP